MRRSAAGCRLVALALVAITRQAASQQAASREPRAESRELQYGVTVSRDTVTVGEPFQIRVRVRAPLGSRINFPDNPDTAAAIQSRDPRVIVTTDSTKYLDQIATYNVAAWDTKRQLAAFRDVIVTSNGIEQRIPLTNVSVYVQTVLPADTALHVPKPARPLWETSPFPWWIVALIVAAIAVLLWWWWRHRRQTPTPVAPAIDPYERAASDFARIEAMGLVDAGERTRFVALVIEVLRDYLAARYPDAHLALTSKELVSLFRRQPTVSTEALTRVLHDADLAKFAGLALADDRARAVGRDARAIVDREHRASRQLDAQAAA